MAAQQRSYPLGRSPFLKWILLARGGVLTLCATILWLLSIEHVIADSWASIVGALFTVLGEVIASLQLVGPSPSLAGENSSYTHYHGPTAKVTISAGRVTAIDWRRL